MPVQRAGVAELVDAPDSKSGSFTGVPVRFRPSVPLASEVYPPMLASIVH